MAPPQPPPVIPLVVLPCIATMVLLVQRAYSAGCLRTSRNTEPEGEGPKYVVSYSETSGSIFAALRNHLVKQRQWHPAPGPRAFNHLDPSLRLAGISLVLGDRYHMDNVIRDWREHILRSGRVEKIGAQPYPRTGAPKHIVLVNYYSGTKELSLKSNLVRHLRVHLKRPWDVTPVTFIIKPRTRRDQRERFLREFETLQRRGETQWIAKPARMNKAVGIRIMADADAILEYIDTHPERGEWVVQKYLERPFLIHGRKFDIRTWMVVGPRYDMWLWREGVLRTSSEPYDPTDLENELSHLTNHCVQEKGPRFSKFEEGNEMWYHQFQEYLDIHYPGYDFRERVVPRIKAIIRACFLAVKPQLIHSCRTRSHELLCYQVFGFDFMMDDNFETWLIEVNGQPAVAQALLPSFTRDTAELVVHPLFPAPGRAPRAHAFECIDPGEAC